MPSRQVAATAVKPVAVDAAAASERLAAAVRLKTIASATDVDANAGEFLALQAHLQASFPKAHAVLRRELIGKYGLLYTWAGSDAQAAPIALMAHQDVVPVAPGTEGDWQVAPFAGAVKDGFVWGRGAWDDKGNLIAHHGSGRDAAGRRLPAAADGLPRLRRTTRRSAASAARSRSPSC